MNRKRFVLLNFFSLFAILLVFSPALFSTENTSVKVWEQETVIPTYIVGPPDPNPMFYFGRASQGAEGRIYPYPLYDNLTGEKKDKTYKLIYLENEYIKIAIMPEIGGRIFEAIDKTNGYNFFYRQHVVKPSLISIIGAWISGGVEWNIPHHHRASTFLPVQYSIEENDDGSKTVWVGELEIRHRMRWAVGCTLRPGRSYIEVSTRILNRTPFVNTFLCFANPAVHVNENYQVIFPPSTQFGTHHAKRQFVTWPIAAGRYGGGDFSDGVDISWYKNHISSNSVFAWNYDDDFVAGYDHGKEAGTMSVADHHIIPGKKFWTWGNGPRGRRQDTILTDDDGPYIEIMVGAYSDNQPDYSWIQPYEVKSFKWYWYPFRDIGGVKRANINAAVNLDVNEDRTAKFGFYTTSAHEEAIVTLKARDKDLVRETVSINPAKAYVKEISIPADVNEYDLRASLTVDGEELVAYSPIRPEPQKMPEAVDAPPQPEEIKTNEELYLTGLRIEQFYNPSLDPDPYWQEALRRDPDDVRVNTALGINYLKKAKFEEAEKLFLKALERLTDKYTSPKDGEPFYYLGVALKAQGRNDEAYDRFYKATWSMAWRAASYYALAEIDCMRGDFASAQEHLDSSLEANALNIRAMTLKASVLRYTGHQKEAMDILATAISKSDPLDVRIMAEKWMLTKNPQSDEILTSTLRDHPATGLETALEYSDAGLWQDASTVLLQMIEAAEDKSKISPLVYYYLGYFTDKQNQSTGHLTVEQKAVDYYRLAAKMPTDYVFPFQWEDIEILECAMKANPSDSQAPYYLGNLLFDWQPEKAVSLWEKSTSLNAAFPIVYRNLAVYYSRQDDGRNKAIANLEKAVSYGGSALHLFELDQQYEEAGTNPQKRLAMFEKYHNLALERDDAVSREISLKIFMGKYNDAIELMQGRSFDIWEGGARFNVSDSWTDAHLLRGQRCLADKQYNQALADFQASIDFPENLQEANTAGSNRMSEVSYWIGCAHEAMGDMEKARQSWEDSSSAGSRGPSFPQMQSRRGGARAGSRRGRGGVRGGGFGDGRVSANTVQRYYQALSLQKLGQNDQAQEIFQELIDSGNQSLEGAPEVDFFAKFGAQQSQRLQVANAYYIAGLGYLGLNQKEDAEKKFTAALQISPDHLGAKTVLAGLN
jgi:tetratricopeptide (TPR) repeat protein